nr:MAG TPA: hypothetical protein [Caudoviricetes sp.]
MGYGNTVPYLFFITKSRKEECYETNSKYR